MSAIIEIEHLTKYYGKHKGIEDVSFCVGEGEICGFIGPNGAGKSTTIRTLLSLIYPTSGSAKIFGLDCIKKAPEIAREVGYLPGETAYYEGMTVAELLNYSAALYGVDCKSRMNHLCERLQLDTKRKIKQLSLGNRKKVGIVQALIHAPKLLILDEPTSGLDPLMQQTLFAILHEEQERGVTVLFSSHVLSEVQRMCDRVVIIKDGTIIKQQRINELSQNGYKRISLTSKKNILTDFFMLDGVANLEQSENTASFLYSGNIARIVERINQLDVIDLCVAEPDLEEIFLHYYE